MRSANLIQTLTKYTQTGKSKSLGNSEDGKGRLGTIKLGSFVPAEVWQ